PEITFTTGPVETLDSTKMSLTGESFKPLTHYSLTLDSTRKKLTVKYPWTENTAYNLILDTAFATDTSGRRIPRNDAPAFRTERASEYGLVRLRFRGLPRERHPVLQFLQGNEVKFSHVFTNHEFNAKLLQPGEYELRIVFDTNRIGEWDTGQFFGKRIQPE